MLLKTYIKRRVPECINVMEQTLVAAVTETLEACEKKLEEYKTEFSSLKEELRVTKDQLQRCRDDKVRSEQTASEVIDVLNKKKNSLLKKPIVTTSNISSKQ